MSERDHRPRSLEAQLLDGPRRTAGVDGAGQPVRLGERDSAGRIVGFIDEQGLAWESLTEMVVATQGNRLAEALALRSDDPWRDRLMDQILGEVPDELIADVAQEAAGQLWLKSKRAF